MFVTLSKSITTATVLGCLCVCFMTNKCAMSNATHDTDDGFTCACLRTWMVYMTYPLVYPFVSPSPLPRPFLPEITSATTSSIHSSESSSLRRSRQNPCEALEHRREPTTPRSAGLKTCSVKSQRCASCNDPRHFQNSTLNNK